MNSSRESDPIDIDIDPWSFRACFLSISRDLFLTVCTRFLPFRSDTNLTEARFATEK